MIKQKSFRLRTIISLLIIFVITITASIDWFVSMHLYKKTLTEIHLESNYNYVNKLQTTAQHQINNMTNNLVALGKMAKNENFNQDVLNEWAKATSNHFNFLFITDENGKVEMVSTYNAEDNIDLDIHLDSILDTPEIIRALSSNEVVISEPYFAVIDRLVVLISAPIIDLQTNKQSGIIAGVINLQDRNVLQCIFGRHKYGDDTYVYVVDRKGSLIFHPEEERLGEDVSSNIAVQKVMNGESGSEIITNSKGHEFFASFTTLESTGWGIVVQTYTDIIKEPLNELFWNILLVTIPILFVIFIVSGIIVSIVTRPINHLANLSNKVMSGQFDTEDINKVKISTFVYEVKQLYTQILDHMQTLEEMAKLDGLTKLLNRSSFDQRINRCLQNKDSFSLILFDIDHFKKVNDTYGHLVGDEVLKYLAEKMKKMFSNKGKCFRYGGEEFAIILPHTDENEAYKLAEEFRKLIECTISPTGEPINISLGITKIQESDENVKQIIDRADEALYTSKRTGRNKTTLYR